MTGISVAVVSIVPTARRRFFWAAWWTGAPTRQPFRKPDASNGGAVSLEDALAQAEKRAGRTLSLIDSHWAQAWSRVLRELPPFPSREPREARPPRERPTIETPWTILGIPSSANELEVKQAYRLRALALHPDHGGDPAGFRALKAAYDKASVRARKRR